MHQYIQSENSNSTLTSSQLVSWLELCCPVCPSKVLCSALTSTKPLLPSTVNRSPDSTWSMRNLVYENEKRGISDDGKKKSLLEEVRTSNNLQKPCWSFATENRCHVEGFGVTRAWHSTKAHCEISKDSLKSNRIPGTFLRQFGSFSKLTNTNDTHELFQFQLPVDHFARQVVVS